MNGPDEGPQAVAEALQTLRDRGAERLEPVRWAHLQALARRAAARDGTQRNLLDQRLQQLLADCRLALDRRSAAGVVSRADGERPTQTGTATAQADGPALSRGADGAEVSSVSDAPGVPRTPRAKAMDTMPAAPARLGLPTLPDPAPDLRAVQRHRGTWQRLAVERSVTHSRGRVPDGAGPLNTQRLLHQAMAAMRDASPEYLYRMMRQVEALLWLQAACPAAGSASPRTAARRQAEGPDVARNAASATRRVRSTPSRGTGRRSR